MNRVWAAKIVVPVAAIVMMAIPATALGLGEFEPNDTFDTAAGPLIGGHTYTAGIETSNDKDFYSFYMRRFDQVDFAFKLSGSDGDAWACFWILNSKGQEVDDAGDCPYAEGITNHAYVSLDAGKYYVKVSDANSDALRRSYSFSVRSNGSIASDPACGDLIVKQLDAKDAVKRTKKQLKYASGKNRKHKLRRLLKRERKAKRRLTHKLNKQCPV